MKLVVFGLTVSSSWGNGHATLWRGLIRALARKGCRVVFFERNVSWYAEHRDLNAIEGGDLVLYESWREITARARAEIRSADAVMVTSYCPDGALAAELAVETAGGATIFYDMDTGVTLARVLAGERVDYLPEHGLGDFDFVLSYTGGRALALLQSELGARRTAPFYGHADPETHRPAASDAAYRADLSYIGTYAADRQLAVESLFLTPAALRPQQRFVLAGAGYPQDFPWSENIWFTRHLPPGEHPSFYCASRMTLNVTRPDMAAMGWCPSGRLFEAAACGTPVISDAFAGLEAFFEPGEEILITHGPEDVTAALDRPRAELKAIGARARERFLAEHTSAHRADQLMDMIGFGASSAQSPFDALVPEA